MFIDDVKIRVQAGNGGNGIVAFRREKYVPKGGPAGGDGGKGGSIIFVGDRGLTTLLDLKYRMKIKAENGQNGMPKNMFGAQADDVYVKVPIGSVVHDLDKGLVIADITEHGQKVVIAKGGRGGRGNASFASARVPAPEICEKGEPGEAKFIRVELKVLADVGLVGFPSVGKSTLISVVSACKPKIAPYHFTTLVPNLGVATSKDGRSFVIADLPGLIEGASSGAGLGFQFLRHIERTRVIVHLIDMACTDGRDPYDDYLAINKELETYNPKLMLRPQIIVANKMDMPNAQENLEKFKEKLGPDKEVIAISAYTNNNLDILLYKIADLLDQIEITDFDTPVSDEVVEYKYVAPEANYHITKEKDGIYNITGPKVKKYFDSTDFENEEQVRLFAKRLRDMGIEDELRKLGVENGDTVRIFDYEFEFFD